ncbi:MAG: NlpD5 [candidate division WS6 bacterium 34_10]|uniref:NlpD5 n=1 Tax=candidate division WS6 bacterium 34_10 TaxID=1641389 RepID=A0A124FXC5_9BACT|nr:MAG: NlpD5 [candidate division WS6 bacterium 34_10]
MKLLKVLLLFLSPIYAHTDVEVYIGSPVNIQWQEYGDEYEYMVEIYQLRDSAESLIYTSDWILENSIDVEIEEESSYLWKIYIREIGKKCDDDYQCFNVESGYFDFYFPPEQEEPEDTDDEEQNIDQPPVVKQEGDTMEIKPKVNRQPIQKKEVLGTTVTTEKYIPKEEFQEPERVKEVKAVEETKEKSPKEGNYCEYIYNVNRERFRLIDCEIDKPKITSSTYSTYNGMYIVNSKGRYTDSVKIYIKNAVCRNFDILNPTTWFGCDEVVTSADEYDIKLNHEVYFFNKKVISPSSYIFRDKEYEIAGIYSSLPSNLIFKGYFSLKHRGNWLDQELAIKMPTTFKKIEDGSKSSNGIYSFPFSRIVNVNQWHGCTAYQCPHKGIDFAVAKEKIYASGSGTVVAKGYDNYYGECNSGGNYLLVKYDSGHHMSYMHLEKTYVKNGQRVKEGELLALSGNTGANNCQPLGYHLHFELREKSSQSTHIDPVPFIDINWSLVKTNKSNIYPKRLSGDNPHPSY